MNLLSEFLEITQQWRRVFPQQRTFERAVRQALGSLVCLGRRCLTRIIWTNGGQNRSWSAEYFLHSRCQWEPQELFRPILKRALAYCPQRLVGVALDDTRLTSFGPPPLEENVETPDSGYRRSKTELFAVSASRAVCGYL